MNDLLSEYREVFLEEAAEHLRQANDDLVELERRRTDRHLVDRIFRSLHTLKSSAAAVGLTTMSRLAHRAEDLMQAVRSGRSRVSERLINLLFMALDGLERFRLAVAEGRPTESVDVAAILDALAPADPEGEATAAQSPAAPSATPRQVAWRPDLLREAAGRRRRLYQLDVVVAEAEPLKWLRAELLLNHLKPLCGVLDLDPPKTAIVSRSFDGVFSLLLASDADPKEILAACSLDLIKSLRLFPVAQAATPPTAPPPPSVQTVPTPARPTDSIRVRVDRLDHLMDLVGELATQVAELHRVAVRAEVAGAPAETVAEWEFVSDRLGLIARELQDRIMETRLQPVSSVLAPFRRIVRDLAVRTGKKVELLIEGEETEIDKRILDALGEPLTHLVRNAVDHGVEPPTERHRRGKPETARVVISVSRAGDHVFVSVRDDGRGMDERRIAAKALERGLVSAEELDRMSPAEVRQFVFLPGFSTAEKVTDLSGRGVGLDVVKDAVTALRGSVEVLSTPGEGTEFRLVVPLTVATTTVLLCPAGPRLLAVPISDVVETFSWHPGMLRWQDGHTVLDFRGTVIPLADPEAVFAGRKDPVREGSKILVLSSHRTLFGFLVDDIEGISEVVVKPLDLNYRHVEGLSGAAILGDGRLALVLDVYGFFRLYAEEAGLEREFAAS